MVLMGTAAEIKQAFVEWNGWGPPTSEYQINEYCRDQVESLDESDHVFEILFNWMRESQI